MASVPYGSKVWSRENWSQSQIIIIIIIIEGVKFFALAPSFVQPTGEKLIAYTECLLHRLGFAIMTEHEATNLVWPKTVGEATIYSIVLFIYFSFGKLTLTSQTRQ